MKVYELIHHLSEMPAGAQVLLGTDYTESLPLEECQREGRDVVLFVSDPRLLDKTADPSKHLSEVAEFKPI